MKASVNFSQLRQVGDVLAQRSHLDAAARRRQQADNAFEQGAFARAVGPGDCGQ